MTGTVEEGAGLKTGMICKDDDDEGGTGNVAGGRVAPRACAGTRKMLETIGRAIGCRFLNWSLDTLMPSSVPQGVDSK